MCISEKAQRNSLTGFGALYTSKPLLEAQHFPCLARLNMTSSLLVEDMLAQKLPLQLRA
jgi:hypothetical protein